MKQYKINDIVNYDNFICQIVWIEESGLKGVDLIGLKVFSYEKQINYIHIRSDEKILRHATEVEIKYFGLPFQQVMERKLDEIKQMLTKLLEANGN